MVQSLAGPMPFTCKECKSEFLEADRSDNPVLAEEDTCNRHSCKTIKFGDCHGGWYKFFPDGGLYSISYLCKYCETKISLKSYRASGGTLSDKFRVEMVRKLSGYNLEDSIWDEHTARERAAVVTASNVDIDDYMVYSSRQLEKARQVWSMAMERVRARNEKWGSNDSRPIGVMAPGDMQGQNKIVKKCLMEVDMMMCLFSRYEGGDALLFSTDFGMFTGRGPACIGCVNTEGSGAPPLQSPRYDEEDDYGSPQQSGSDRKRYGGNS